MGQQVAKMCGNTDFFQKLLQEYGDDFVKLILAEKAKQTLEEKFKEILKKLRETVKLFESKVNNIVDGKSLELNENFEELKAKVNDTIPDGIPFLERTKGESINEFSGFNKMVDKIDQIRDETLEQVGTQQELVENQLVGKKTLLYNEIEKQRPKVPLYENLPDSVRFQILEKGEEEFKEQIAKAQEREKLKSDQAFGESMGELDSNLSMLNPQNLLREYIQNAVEEMARNTFGDGIGGHIGDFMDIVF